MLKDESQISRQARWQRKHRAMGLCVLCSRPAFKGWRCKKHYEQHKITMRLRYIPKVRGRYKPREETAAAKRGSAKTAVRKTTAKKTAAKKTAAKKAPARKVAAKKAPARKAAAKKAPAKKKAGAKKTARRAKR